MRLVCMIVALKIPDIVDIEALSIIPTMLSAGTYYNIIINFCKSLLMGYFKRNYL